MAHESYCKACGRYIPVRLNGQPTDHDCGQTPPLDGLPPHIYACPICFGYGLSRWGCWGTATHPHEHAYMLPVYELLSGKRNDS